MAQQSLTIWEKSTERSYAKKYLHGNFKSGHRTPNEHYLGRAGLRGRKRWICLGLFVVLYLLAAAHLVLTCVILGVLRFDFEGSPYLDFQDDGSLTWPQGASLSTVRLATPSSIRAHTNQSLTISGQQDDKVAFQTSGMERLSLDSSSVNISTDLLQVYTSRGDSNRQLQLSVTNSRVEMKDLLRANSLKATKLSTHTVSNVSEVRASGQLLLSGAVGVNLQGRQIDISANGGIMISSQEAITIAAEQVLLSNLPGLNAPPAAAATQHHLCSCDNGRLFLVETNPQRCASADNSICT
ncbi:beta-sarcoglycan-like [Halichondria panicea]|uniref:beta-sarcoglycan-like n=1 Tax=Halichondria panicea TaxID=6063 RepID=UPI00312BB4AA